MDLKYLQKKEHLIDWISKLEDEEIIAQLLKLKKELERSFVVSEPETEYAVKDDFEERWVKGLTSEESRARTKKFLESLPWKK
ncbi:hypothetical protein MTP09_05060 [Chryseobacterium suipulveris]|uniref:Addiction module protein n=1 Tax=Chryseobacterium suipulveris TaxID=2929800 RepID=A0ABY4BS22_9FLAO|nr:hypothetical protein [Chryseobacterium suipulveris]UOE42005.1 hypothetical protein MTP09_05060 [Chryseobacterium suipulveris]